MSDTTKQAEEWIGWARHRTMGQISMGSDPVPLMQDLLAELAAANERIETYKLAHIDYKYNMKTANKRIADLEAEVASAKDQIANKLALGDIMDQAAISIIDDLKAEIKDIRKVTAQEICEYLSPIINIDSYTMEHIKQKYGIIEERTV